ncbi:MAG: hypothetical protein DRJ60_05695 [Thermoprotei archaeon]|nr:MAG: hypothetical protein DRJ60_05695 [Thermoprotei archaeon]
MNLDKLIELFNELEEAVWSKRIKPIKASTLADYYWCSRRSYLKFILENTPEEIEDKIGLDFSELVVGNLKAIKEGLEIHGVSYGFHVDIMEEPPKELAIIKALAGEVIPRNLKSGFGVFQVQGAIDEIEVNDDGCIIREIKTTSRSHVSKHSLAPAKFQVRIYGWLITHYMPVKRLELIFVNRPSRNTVHKEVLEFNESDVESEIIRVISDYKHKALQKPVTWKCSSCGLRVLCERVFK